MQYNSDPNRWFALRVKGRSEKVVSKALCDKGYEAFLPTYPPMRGPSPRAKNLEQPFFPGYVFCRFDVYRRLPILLTPCVLHIVGIGRSPLAVDDEEIASLQRAVEKRLVALPIDFPEIGEKVRIVGGALAGMEGVLLECKNSFQMVLSVTLLRRSVRVEIHRELVTASSLLPVTSTRATRERSLEESVARRAPLPSINSMVCNGTPGPGA